MANTQSATVWRLSVLVHLKDNWMFTSGAHLCHHYPHHTQLIACQPLSQTPSQQVSKEIAGSNVEGYIHHNKALSCLLVTATDAISCLPV